MRTLSNINEGDLKLPEYHVFKSEYNSTQRSAIMLVNESINMVNEIEIKDYELYKESIFGSVINFAKDVIEKITTFVKKMFQSIVGFIAKPFGVKFSWMIDKEDKDSGGNKNIDIEEDKDSNINRIKNKEKFKINSNYFNYDFDLVNPMPIIENWYSSTKSKYLELKNSKGKLKESDKINVRDMDQFNKYVYDKDISYFIEPFINYLSKIMNVKLDSTYMNKLEGIIKESEKEFDIIRKNSSSDQVAPRYEFSSIKSMLPDKDIPILTIDSIRPSMLNEHLSFAGISIMLLQSVVTYLGYLNKYDINDPKKSFLEYSELLNRTIENIKTETGTRSSQVDMVEAGSISSIFDHNNLPISYSLYSMNQEKHIRVPSKYTLVFNEVFRTIHGKNVNIKEDNEMLLGALRYTLNKNKINGYNDFKKLNESVYSSRVNNSANINKKLNNSLTQQLNIAISELNKLENKDNKDSYYKQLEKTKDPNDERTEDLLKKSKSNIEKDLRFFKELLDGEVKILEDLIEFTTVSETTIRTGVAISVLSNVKPITDHYLNLYKDLIYSKNDIPNKNELMNEIESMLDLL